MTRVEKIQKHFPAGVDAFITSNEKTCLYISEFLFHDGMLFVTKDDATIFTDFRYLEAAEQEAVGCKVTVAPRFDEIRKIIAEKDIKTIGYEDDLLVVAELEKLKSSARSRNTRTKTKWLSSERLSRSRTTLSRRSFRFSVPI